MIARFVVIVVAIIWPFSAILSHDFPYVVVVDAGHGGHDPGALSPSTGGREKAVTLAIARVVRDKLDNAPNIEIILTRSDDRFLSLVARRRIAENRRADLFVSIHADSAPSPGAHGASVYTLTEDGRMIVVDRMAAAATLDGIALARLDADTAAVLGDLKQRGAMNDAAVFAATLGQEMESSIPVRARFHQAARFAVLKARGIPAVLIETGYVTNADDAETLFSKGGQKKIAKAIAGAIRETAKTRERIDRAQNRSQ